MLLIDDGLHWKSPLCGTVDEGAWMDDGIVSAGIVLNFYLDDIKSTQGYSFCLQKHWWYRIDRPPKATTDINHDFVPPQARNGNVVLCTDEQQVFHSSVSSSSGWNFPTPTPSIMHGWINRYRFGVIFRFMRTATLPACSLMDEENSWQKIEGQRGRRWEHSYFGFLY